MRSPGAWQGLPFTLLALLISSATAQHFYGGLVVEVTKKVECKRHTRVDDILTVHYRGTLQSNGKEFDSSYGRGTPFTFTLGVGQVIEGWDKGMVGMCPGEGRKLTIPPAMAYGDRNMGVIPPKSTLIFETELLAIENVEDDNEEDEGKSEDTFPIAQPDSSDEKEGEKEAEPEAEAEQEQGQGSEDGPEQEYEEDSGECKLLGPFALLVQGALGILAIMSLVWKRWRETPRRPLKVWCFDVSKQVFGSMLLHLLNLLMSMFSSGEFDITRAASLAPPSGGFVQDDRHDRPNPCSFYLLNLAIDTTIGIPVLVILLRILHVAFSYTPLAKPAGSLRSGNYGHPPNAVWWLKQSLIYFIGLFGMKLFVFFLFQILPWLGWVGDWALRWTEGKAWMQITFSMLVFPLIMNALQYYIIDSFIKDPSGGTEEGSDEQGEEENEGLIGGRRDSEDDGEERGVLRDSATKEANPTPLPVEYDSDEDKRAGGSSRESTAKDIRA